jgi:hypothetical protein
MKHTIRKIVFLTFMALMISSCAKEEFAVNKGTQNKTESAALETNATLCAQSTLISPKVDILMLWDNSTSFNVVTPETRASMGNLISSVSENFDYHVLSVPLISTNSNPLYQAQLVAKNKTGLGSSALGILKSKEVAASSLSFTPSPLASEPGVDRAISILQNSGNGIFRQDAYTIIVVISNEDDDTCESETRYASCASSDWLPRLETRINKLLCLRGNTYENCANAGVAPLNSTMMRFINISPLTSCSTGNNKINYRYRTVAQRLYEAEYSNGWPKSNDHLSPVVAGAFDSYNLCSISFSHIFDGVNTAIKQTLLKHKYDYWPVADSNASIDPDTIRVVRSDGKILSNRAINPSAPNGYELILDTDGKAKTLTNQNTRYYPTVGESFTGKMIKLYGNEGNDKVVYPDCLKVTYTAEKLKYGYIYLKYGEPNVSTIEVRINGAVIPQSSSNGWSYMGLQYTAALDQNLKVSDLPAGSTSGYIVKLNGNAQFDNTSAVSITVYYNSKNQ